MPVKDVQNAVAKAREGKRLGVHQQRVIQSMLDTQSGYRDQGVEFARSELEKSRELCYGVVDDNVPVPGEHFEESEYDPKWDAETRSLNELAREAELLDPDRTEDITQSGRDRYAVAKQLTEIISNAKRKQPAGQEQQPVAPARTKRAVKPESEAKLRTRLSDDGNELKATNGKPYVTRQAVETALAKIPENGDAFKRGEWEVTGKKKDYHVTRKADADGQAQLPGTQDGKIDRNKSLDAADRSENFGLSRQERTGEQREDEAKRSVESAQTDAFGGQAQAAKDSRNKTKGQPDAGVGGGLFGGQSQSNDLIGENSKASRDSLQRLLNDPNAPRIQGTLINGKDSNGRSRPDWKDVGGGFSAREYIRDDQAIQEVRAQDGAIARRRMRKDGHVVADLEANATLGDFLSGAPFKQFESFFNGGRRGQEETESVIQQEAGGETLEDFVEKLGGARNDRRLNSKENKPRNLYVAHNLNAENLKHADELGGLAAPSLAVANIDKGSFDSFGDITLLARPNLLRSPKARTFDADVYSPRQPRAVHKINDKPWRKLHEELREQFKEAGRLSMPEAYDVGRNGAQDIARSPAVEYLYLKSIGKAPKPVKLKADREVVAASKTTDPAKIQKQALKYYQRRLREIEEAEYSSEKLKGLSLQRAKEWFEEDGSLAYRSLDSFQAKARNYRSENGIDSFETERKISKKMRVKSVQDGYKKYVNEIAGRVLGDKGLWRGFSKSGSKLRNKPYTMANVVREMTRQLQGGENYNYGPGSIRAKYAGELKSIKAIQDRRDRIVSKEDMDALRKESSDKVISSIDSLRPYYRFDATGFRYLDDASLAIAEGPRGWNEAFDLDTEGRKIITDLVDYLRSLPTEYFETKIGRAVGIEEFHTAVVPRGTNKDTIDLLKRKGLKLRYYSKNKEGDKQRAIRGAGNGILFSRGQAGEFDANAFAPANDTSALNPLRRALIKAHGRAVEIQAVQPKGLGKGATRARGLQKYVNDVFGRKIEWFTSSDPLAPAGVTLLGRGDRIFVNAGSKTPLEHITGHELVHSLKQSNPQAYEDLAAGVKGLLKGDSDYAKRLREQYDKDQIDLHTDVSEEFIAEVVGAHFTEPGFMRELAGATSPSKFKRIVNQILAWLDKLLAKLKGFKRSKFLNDHVVDANAARRAVLSGVADMARTRGITVTPKDHPLLARMVAWHGTPHDFKRFSMHAIGSGEGAQAYGYGLYFASKREIAEFYRDNLSINAELKRLSDEMRQQSRIMDKYETSYRKYSDPRGYEAAEKYDALMAERSNLKDKNKLYQVNITPHESEFLDWDKPLSEQPQKVQDALANAPGKLGDRFRSWIDKGMFMSGAQIYQAIGESFSKQTGSFGRIDSILATKDAKLASEYLNSIGIPGVRHLDGTSRSKGEGSHNYVLFDDSLVEIQAKFMREGQADGQPREAETTYPVGQLYDYAGKPFSPGPKSSPANSPLQAYPITRKEADLLQTFSGVFRVDTQGPETTGNQGWFIRTGDALEYASRGITPSNYVQRGLETTINRRQYGALTRATNRETVEFSANNGPEKLGHKTWSVIRAGNKPTPRTPQGTRLFSRSNKTKREYDARIDELFQPGAKPDEVGAKILDASDVMGLMGYREYPLYLNESKVLDGQQYHNLTAADWKKVPDWIENPAAVFDSDTRTGSLVVLAPEVAKNGAPIVITIRPNTERARMDAHIVTNAYDKDSGRPPFSDWINNGLTRYYNPQKSLRLSTTARLQLPSVVHPRKGSGDTVYGPKMLRKYRAENAPRHSRDNRRTPEQRANDERHAQALEKDLAPTLSKLRQRLPVRVVSELPQDYLNDPKAAGSEGVYDHGEIVLFASHINDAGHALEVLRHESVGHFGMQQILGDNFRPTLAAVRKLINDNAQMADIAQQVRERYDVGKDNGLDEGSDTFVEEVIAVSAEKKVDLPFMRRIIAHIRAFLRRLGLLKGDVTRDELHGLLAQAGRYAMGKGRVLGVRAGQPLFSRRADTGRNKVKMYGTRPDGQVGATG